jgi:hypothetical protein
MSGYHDLPGDGHDVGSWDVSPVSRPLVAQPEAPACSGRPRLSVQVRCLVCGFTPGVRPAMAGYGVVICPITPLFAVNHMAASGPLEIQVGLFVPAAG